MNGIAVILTLAAVGVDYGWQPGPDGKLEYIVQIEPSLFDAMKSGREIASEIHPDARDVRRFRIRVGTAALPRTGTVAPDARVDAGSGDRMPQGGANDLALDGTRPDLFPYAAPSPGILNLPPPPAMIGPDGKASVLVRPGDNALPAAVGPIEPDLATVLTNPANRASSSFDATGRTSDLPTPIRDTWQPPDSPIAFPNHPPAAPPDGQLLPPGFNSEPAVEPGRPVSPVPGPGPETGLPLPIRSSGMNQEQPSNRFSLRSLLANDREKRTGLDDGHDPAADLIPGAAAQKPTIDEETAAQLKELEATRPWVPLVLTSLALFGSLAANAYLGWVAMGIYRRYRDMCEQLHRAQASLT